MPSNYREWVSIIDINIDYFSAFIKAWIAFNSWYNSKYEGFKDSEIIRKLKEENNSFKNHIVNYIQGNAAESIDFKNNLSSLNIALDNSDITSQLRSGTCEMISFSRIARSNPMNNIPWINIRYNKIKIERTNSSIQTLIQKRADSSTIFDFNQETYNEEELNRHPDFTHLSEELQRKCIELYRSINPYIYETILSSTSRGIKVGEFKFIDNVNNISSGIIEVLYLLRCSLLHGDVTPNNASMDVYKNAYYILCAILKRI